ncbi:MAG: cytochrome c [Chitinophagales bacterium]|nr:cytochrome c [Chitinophagales bacterium]
MFKYLLYPLTLFLVLSCGKKEENTSENEQPTSMVDENPLAEKKERGKLIYDKACVTCHQSEGAGVANTFPPLAKSDYLNADVNKVIDGLLHGNSGEMVVNGVTYNGVMPPQTLNDDEIADVLTYVYNNWENNALEVTPEMVAQRRTAN